VGHHAATGREGETHMATKHTSQAAMIRGLLSKKLSVEIIAKRVKRAFPKGRVRPDYIEWIAGNRVASAKRGGK